MAMGTATASTAPASGAITCGASGSAVIKPGIPTASAAPATKKLKLQAKNATISACNSTGVTGGKEAITGGVATLKGTIPPGATCSTLLSAPPSLTSPALTVKFTGADGKAVAKITLKSLALAQSGLGFSITGVVPVNPKKPFSGETVTVQANVDNTTDALNCITGVTGADLTHIDFSAAGGSTISIA